MLKNIKARAVFSSAMLLSGSLFADHTYPNGCKGPELCHSFPMVDSCALSVEVGAIVEQMRILNTDVIQVEIGGGAGTAASPSYEKKVLFTDFNLGAGVRVGLGSTFNHDEWRGRAQFEWISQTGKQNVSLDSGFLVATNNTRYNNLSNSSLPNFTKADTALIVDYYLVDLLLSRGSYFSSNFSYEPFAGLKVAVINYEKKNSFSSAENATAAAANTSWLNRAWTKFWGVGPMFGLNSDYSVCGGWSVFSSSNLAVLLGKTQIRDYIGYVTTETTPTSEYTRINDDVLTPTVRTILGLKYCQKVFEDKNHFAFRIGFDGRYYFNQYPIVERVPVAAVNTAATSGTGNIVLEEISQLSDYGAFGMIGFVIDVAYDF